MQATQLIRPDNYHAWKRGEERVAEKQSEDRWQMEMEEREGEVKRGEARQASKASKASKADYNRRLSISRARASRTEEKIIQRGHCSLWDIRASTRIWAT